jgi:hypothetical protein
MNDDTKNLREMIERATATPASAGDEMPHDLDADTASLHGGWLQLGKLIEEDVKSGNRNDRSGHVANRDHEPAIHAAPSSGHRRPAWSFWLATCAASLFVAAGIVFTVHFLNGPHAPQGNLQQIAGRGDRAKQPAAPVVAPTPVPSPETPSSDPLQWGDSVDDEITAVGQATIYAQQDVYAQSSGVWGIRTGLEELEQEMDRGNL